MKTSTQWFHKGYTPGDHHLDGTDGVVCQPKTITILHTNDMHASFIPHEHLDKGKS